MKKEKNKRVLKTKIAMVSAEVDPFAKTGGLGDVVGSLPSALNKVHCNSIVIMPLYGIINQKYKDMMKYLGYIYVDLGWRHQYCGVFTLKRQYVTYYFLDNEFYFDRGVIYDEMDLEKFSFLSLAAFEVLKYIKFKPDIIHIHDWHTGVMAALLHDYYHYDDFFKNTKCVYTIHNLAYQGKFNKFDVLDLLPLDRSKYDNTNTTNYMALGIIYADVVTTVSISYAHEILSQSYGEGLQDLLNHEANKLRGILNGINEKIYDPSKDKLIYHKYTKDNYAEGKLINKKSLFKDLNFNENEADDTILIGVISRLVSQKGLDLLLPIMEELLNNKVKLVVLGTGNKNIEESFKNISLNHQDKFAALIKFDNEIAHKLYAACDLLLVPSLFEPCGLTQMIALQYGTIPLVRECGGLKDSIIPFNEYTNEGNGFSFKEYNSNDLYNTILYAINIYKQKEKWNTIINNGFACDFSWTNSALKYKELYESLK